MNWAYIAGFFDGEGCLHAIGASLAGKSRFRVTISQTQEEVLEEIAGFLQEHGIAAYVLAQGEKRTKALHHKPCWNVWITKQRSVVKFIDNVLPYLRVKKQRAEDYRRLCVLTPQLQGTHPVVYSDGHIQITDPTDEQKAGMRPVNGYAKVNRAEFIAGMRPVNGYAKINRAEFIAAMREGKSVTEAALMFGLDYSTAHAKAKRLGFHIDSTAESNRKRAKIPMERIAESFAITGSFQETARQLGMNPTNVQRRLLKNGITPNPPYPRGGRRKGVQYTPVAGTIVSKEGVKCLESANTAVQG